MSLLASDLMNELRCNISDDDHFLEDACILSCGHNACKECIKKTKGREFTCQFADCKKKQKIKNLEKLTANKSDHAIDAQNAFKAAV